MRLLPLIFLFPLVALAQPANGPYNVPGSGTGGSATNSSTVSAGTNMVVTTSQNANGSTNFSVALADTINLSQANIGTAWLTNVVVPTNSFVGTVVDFAKAEGRTNLGGNLTFTAVANVTAGVMNSRVITLGANGADRTIAFPASFHIGRNNTLVVTNGTESEFLFRLQPGVRTNVYQLDSL